MGRSNSRNTVNELMKNEYERKIEEMNQENEKAKKEYENMTQRIIKKNEIITNKIQIELNEKKNKNYEYEKELNEIRNENEQLKNEAKKYEDKVSDLEKALLKSENIKKVYKSEIKKIKDENEIIKKKYEEYKKNIEEDLFEKNNRITIIYKINNNEDEIRIFGNEFVKNNKKNCKIIYGEKEHELTEFFDLKNKYKEYAIYVDLIITISKDYNHYEDIFIQFN